MAIRLVKTIKVPNILYANLSSCSAGALIT